MPELPPSPATGIPARAELAHLPQIHAQAGAALGTVSSAFHSPPRPQRQLAPEAVTGSEVAPASNAHLYSIPATPPRMPRGNAGHYLPVAGIGAQTTTQPEAASSLPASPSSTAKLPSGLLSAAREEANHEIVRLSTNGIEMHAENFQRFKSAYDSTTPVCVVGFLGDTSAGKSHTIASLMEPHEE